MIIDKVRPGPEGTRPFAMQSRGSSAPLGATVEPGGVNVSLYSRDASGIELLLFDRTDEAKPAHIITLDPQASRTYHYWHVFVPGIQPGQMYAFRAHGPF